MRAFLATILVFAAGGCASVPGLEFQGPSFPMATSPSEPGDARAGRSLTTSQVLVRHLLCEIVQAETFAALAGAKYTMVVNLNLNAEDNLGAAPTLNFITPKAVASTSDTAILGGEISRKRERVLAQELEFKLSDLQGKDAYCKPLEWGPYLRGDLGVREIMERTSTLRLVPTVPAESARLVPAYDALDPSVTKFGSTVKFTIKWGAALGPHIVRAHFKGPSDKGLFSASRIDTSTLIVSFAKPPETEPPKSYEALLRELLATAREEARTENKAFSSLDQQAVEAAAEQEARRLQRESDRVKLESDMVAAARARELTTQMILQNLTISPN